MPGSSEIILIFLIILLLFGGKELPRFARSFGKWMSIFQRSMNEVRREFNRISIEEELKEREIQGVKHQEAILQSGEGADSDTEAREKTDSIYQTDESELKAKPPETSAESPTEQTGDDPPDEIHSIHR